MKKLLALTILMGSLISIWTESVVAGDVDGQSNTTVGSESNAKVNYRSSPRSADLAEAVELGMKCDGVTDDTAALQAAINTGRRVHLPSGRCLITNSEVIRAKSQIIEGNGHAQTVLEVSKAFNLSGAGVFVAKTGENGPIFRDFAIKFVQPNVNSRSQLIKYPPAFYLQNTPRFEIRNIRVSGAMSGVDMRGNSGGSFIDTLELSAYETGILIDGSLDTVRIRNVHSWPFDMTREQRDIYNDGGAIGIISGRCDGLDISGSVFINNGAQLKLIRTRSGITFGYGTNLDFDTHGGLVMEDGRFSISSSFFSVGSAENQAIKMTGGYLVISAARFESAVATKRPLIEVTGRGYGESGAHLVITGSSISIKGDMQAVSVETVGASGNSIDLFGNQFEITRNLNQTKAVVSARSEGGLTLVGNRATDHGAGVGNFVSLSADGVHTVANNVFPGWRIDASGSQDSTVISGNIARLTASSPTESKAGR